MKKTYMTPAMSVAEFEAKPMLQITSNGDGTQNAGGSKGNYDDSYTVLSKRRRGIFGSDEEESSNGIW